MNSITEQDSPKERLLKTADRLFYEQGYHSTGINQIIKEAQVCKASFYQHFPSKEALAIAYINNYHAKFLSQLRQLEQQSDTPKEKILALFDYLATLAQQTECRGCAFINMVVEFSQPDSQPRQLIAQFKADLREYIEQLVAAAFPQPSDRESVQTIASAVYLLFEAASIESRVQQDLWPIHASKAAVSQLIF